MMSYAAAAWPYNDAIGSIMIDGGLENLHGDYLFGGAPLGNALDHLFDFRMGFS
jgi:hypothetical protein